jgi:hypothetical protein
VAGRNQGGKGNPASHRIGNARRKERRQQSWLRAQKRHEANRKANEAQHAENVALFGPGTQRTSRFGNHGNGSPGRASRLRRKAQREARRAA